MGSVLVTGGAGYVGSVLVPKLINDFESVIVCDTLWFGNYLKSHPKLRIINKKVADLVEQDLDGVTSVIHLAGIPNDATADLNPNLSWEVNVLHTTILLALCNKVTSIDTFIFASSGSVYGVSEREHVTEEADLLPITIYNKTKMSAERVVKSYSDRFKIFIFRPATICGVSPRMRFDVTVNLFVEQAFSHKSLMVLGGNQVRPNIHIEDMVTLYRCALGIDSVKLPPGIYNAGFENKTISDIASLVAEFTQSSIAYSKSNDPRSYRLNSDKLLNLGFIPQKNVEVAIREVWNALESDEVKIDEKTFSVKWLRTILLAENV